MNLNTLFTCNVYDVLYDVTASNCHFDFIFRTVNTQVSTRRRLINFILLSVEFIVLKISEMPKRTVTVMKKRRNSGESDVKDNELGVLGEPSNSKQKKRTSKSAERNEKSKEKRRNRSVSPTETMESLEGEDNGEVEELIQARREGRVLSASFDEGDDRVVMELMGRDDFSDEGQTNSQNSEEDMDASDESETQESERESEGGRNTNDNSNEIVRRRESNGRSRSRSSDRAARPKTKKRSSAQYEDESSDEEMDPNEFRSMKKFAKFLEKTGYIKKQGGGDREHKKSPQRKQNNAEDRKGKGMNSLDSLISLSGTTIYERAVPMITDENNEISEETIVDEDITFNKRISSSSDELVNTRDELAPLDADVNNEMNENNTIMLNNNDRFLFKQFLEYKMWERKDKDRRRSYERRDGGETSRKNKYDNNRAYRTQEDIKKMVQ